ncbi:hypothetical protein C8J57DRAFT_1061724 [Mycena rebaudengoi]|nr:hypothetical protein C8J57DRAFT_1061724 [Mycena rebaudengoi]
MDVDNVEEEEPAFLTYEEETDTYEGAAQPLKESGESLDTWFDGDKFAHYRSDNVYYPFASKEEWELASFLLRSSMTMKDIDDFLKLQMVCNRLSLSFKTAKELRGRVELLPAGPQWMSETITLPGVSTKKPIVLYYRNALECIEFLLKNPFFQRHLELTPKKVYRNGHRLYSEWITSEGAWDMQQAELPEGGTLLGIVATSDKTNISVMNGDRVAHPFLLSIANIPMDILMKASNHGFMMAALFPVVKFGKTCNKDIVGLLERRLMHRCIDIVCEPLKTAAAIGATMSDSTGTQYKCFTPLAAYINVNKIADPWTEISKYQSESKKYRLSGVDLPFWRDWPLSTNPSRFLTPEALHHWHRGFYDHDFQWACNLLTKPEMDFRLSVIQPRVGFRHFKEGVTHLKQLGGREHRELERCIVAVIADGVSREIVTAIRALLDFRFLAQAPEIDEETIIRIEAALAEFHRFKHHLIQQGGRTQDHFKIPKLEFMHSVTPSIRWAGAPIQFTADVTEKLHSTEIKVPARTQTNHREYESQIVRYLDRMEKMRLFDLGTQFKSSGTQLDPESPADGDEDTPAAQIIDPNPDSDSSPSLTGESARQIRNLFSAGKLHRQKYSGLESRMFNTPSTAFCLNRTPALTISVDDAATLFRLSDLRPALGDYLERMKFRDDQDRCIIGGRRKSAANCTLPFTHLHVWFAVRVQVMSPHKTNARPLAAQNLQAHPPKPPPSLAHLVHADESGDWEYGRCDTVLLCNDRESAWPGEGFRSGIQGHTVAQIRLIMRPFWKSRRLTSAYLMYAQRFDVFGYEECTGMHLLRRALRVDSSRIGDVVEVDHIRTPVEVIARFGNKANSRLTPYNSLECSTEFRLNKYSSKEFMWVHDSVSLA